MKYRQLLSALGVMLFVACSLAAQENAGTIAVLEFQKPKNGMLPQYQAGRKEKAAWHKQQNDREPLMVFEILSGENTGTFVVGRWGQHWADLDKPSVPDEADLAEFQKVIGSSVESVVTRYYEYMPKVSNPAGKGPAKYSEIIVFYVRYGKDSDFRSAIARIHEGAQKTKWAPDYEWYNLSNGGPAGVYVLALPHNNWADFADKPEVKPFREMIKDAFGQDEADSILDRLDHSVEKQTSELVQFRPDLSYLPGK